MIIVSFGGGLGNQMYKYAFLIKMKMLYPNQIFKIDTQYSIRPAHNGYELDKVFGIEEEQCTYFEYRKLAESIYDRVNVKVIRELLYILRQLKWELIGKKKSFIQQIDSTVYEETFWNLKRDQSYFLYGSFANYKYFDDIREVVVKTFCFPKIKDTKNLYYQELIQRTNSVSIHIRRGDYIEEGITLPSEEFYENAMEILENKINNIHYFIFTDDIEYARKKFSCMEGFHLIEGNMGIDSYKDMQLMSLCKHNIIANSTFSFWGAYLNNNPDKIVIAPNLPYTGCSCAFACDDWMLL